MKAWIFAFFFFGPDIGCSWTCPFTLSTRGTVARSLNYQLAVARTRITCKASSPEGGPEGSPQGGEDWNSVGDAKRDQRGADSKIPPRAETPRAKKRSSWFAGVREELDSRRTRAFKAAEERGVDMEFAQAAFAAVYLALLVAGTEVAIVNYKAYVNHSSEITLQRSALKW
eukprot:CAMPEP_0172586182 /NCGR_PEP_ID=MMETSP1068-20121228/5554_1 /TAXON_ID=35684 /ORGANISM="Pseudopedinella elastica, Strain CCMP716" /LENGTH=170 /DNA_ID=CAMNT_0013380889 /DNA_START=80 /DNA_END=592 /DNA_ORIENTATION=-